MSDAQEVFKLRSDREINRYLDRQLIHSIDDARKFIDKITESESLYWAITLNDKDILVGTICLFGFSEENGKCEIGYELLTKFQGQGIMKEAVEKVIEYAFNTVNVKEIEAILHRDNRSSIKLLQKLSFGILDQPDKTKPHLLYYHLTNSIYNLK